ncbi:uncharacterized protein UV8b_04156 [Ustilaginoidea virens]|uniref:R3H-associated N-terminal domain-containing protein n=1 Tax=Ustilaginoidea virens TaxID=1159556 RepID=A0A8E5HQQ1_USTVR|nr:uncharacterized protein UV8b_04156 [Ustilaginoidea virens]QUC19915.1 hypothetical protein UV8b_04156 [Ustilaginoidea virens]
MAIFSAGLPAEETADLELLLSPPTPVTNGAIDIDAWTISALASLSVSPIARGTGTPLAIPLDDALPSDKTPRSGACAAPPHEHGLPRRPPSSRDSMKRREALLRGNEGSRQRRRWENDRLVGVPNVQPPLPADWEVHPTHRVHHVPYQLAQFWDRGVGRRVDDRAARLQAARKKQQLKTGTATGLGVGEVPRDLRETAKRTPAVRNWVRVLEEPVRRFLREEHRRRQPSAQRQQAPASMDAAGSEVDSDDEEIVFVGRDKAMRELRAKKQLRHRKAAGQANHQALDSGVVFDSFGDGESAAFKRWLAHSISDYYGLASRSITLTATSCRVVYVGLKHVHGGSYPATNHLPRPLWELC